MIVIIIIENKGRYHFISHWNVYKKLCELISSNDIFAKTLQFPPR